MLKKLATLAFVFTAGEVSAFIAINREANRLAKRDASPPLVIPPTKPHHYLWADMTTDPTHEHADDPRTVR